MNIDVNNLITAIDGIDDSFILEFSDTEELKKEINKKNKNRKVNFKRLLIAAVISALLIVAGLFAVSSSRDDTIIDLRDGIYKLFSGRSIEIFDEEFEASPEKITPKTGDLVEILEQAGIPDVLLPTALLADEWAVEDFAVNRLEGTSFFAVTGELANDCYIHVNYSEYEEASDFGGINGVKQAKSMIIDGVEVVVAERFANTITMQYYIRNSMENGRTQEISYRIVFDDPSGNNLTFEDVLEIAKTIA